MIRNQNIARDACIDPTKIWGLNSKIGDTFYVAKANSDPYNYLIDHVPDSDHLFTTITAGCAALTDYDTLIIAPGNYDEAATITLTNLDSVKIFGFNTGMQWGEGSTNWRDVTSSSDLLNLTGCKAVEIAGIGFINSTAKDAINFTGLCYSIHIHDCCFVGDCGGGATGVYAINAGGANGPDLYVHDCRFFRYATAGVVAGHQRNVIKDCFFVVPNSGHGVELAGSTTASYNAVIGCHFLGGGTSDVGLYMATSAIGNWMASGCNFANCAEAIQDAGAADSDQNVVVCRRDDAGSGGLTGADPEA